MVQEPFSLVVFDHHPDMQEPRFGNILSCGGWVLEVLRSNPFVQGVTLIGVADHLADEIRSDDKVNFVKESALFQIPDQARNDADQIPDQARNGGIADMVQTSWRSTSRHLESAPLYISIDKDALAPAYAATNWDQGSLSLEHMKAIISEIAKDRKIIGVDICGERARDFAGDEHHTVQEADALNDRINRELVKFLENFF
jgi:arginase family enzyme